MLDFSIKLINSPQEFPALAARLASAPALALDIETVNWWDRHVERVALIQLAFREGGRLRVAVVDALAGLDLEGLRPGLESSRVPKAIHNASYDAVRLARHFRIHTSPIHDTMLAARRNGEKRYSLQAQAQAHLGFQLDKSEQRGDWGRRPLALKQLRYAALDAACTLLLYEDQIARGVSASYQLREITRAAQTSLPLSDAEMHAQNIPKKAEAPGARSTAPGELDAPVTALLGVVSELNGRYSPERLAVSADSERVGLAGWIIDGVLGRDADLDEDAAKIGIAELIERGLVSLNAARRLEATEAGRRLWLKLKPA
ncbi:MAG TPA: ribonuclease D [Pyrinomonadaceae bacterium]|nr:ribonuclease D [Pyrinomonadaceae bacterium]